MTEQFKDQGGAANMNPSALFRWLSSKFMTEMVSEKSLVKRRAKAEKLRLKNGLPHKVEYFHQVNDGYSHLAMQLLQPLIENYDIDLTCHLVQGPSGDNLPEPDLLLDLSRRDSQQIAPHYGLSFPSCDDKPGIELVSIAESILVNVGQDEFPAAAKAVGAALWAGDSLGLEQLVEQFGRCDDAETRDRVEEGTTRRHRLNHYSGAMFFYAGEWYWGVDRIYHLEKRLLALGAKKGPDEALLYPRPTIDWGDAKNDGSITLEFYPSLRSPYTSVIFQQTVSLAKNSGVKLLVRPVLPMVMRGVPATREKGLYIFRDAAREARALGLTWGSRIYDPIGNPVHRCYSLYPWARQKDREVELLDCFLKAAFSDGVNTNSDRGMRQVVENAGLLWNEAKQHIDGSDMLEELEANRLAMYEFGSWGVPSYRLLDQSGKTVLALWGQDRLWLFAREIKRLLNTP